MKNLISGIFSIIIGLLNFAPIFKYDEKKLFSVGYVDGKLEYFYEFIGHNGSFIDMLRANQAMINKILPILFFIICILAGIYYILKFFLKFKIRNLDLIISLIVLASGLSVFMITNLSGHIVCMLPVLLFINAVLFEMREN